MISSQFILCSFGENLKGILSTTSRIEIGASGSCLSRILRPINVSLYNFCLNFNFHTLEYIIYSMAMHIINCYKYLNHLLMDEKKHRFLDRYIFFALPSADHTFSLAFH